MGHSFISRLRMDVVAGLRKLEDKQMGFTKQQYTEYLQSGEWARKKQLRLEIDEHRCRMCGKTDREVPLECHHINYRSFFNEDLYKDLISLCPECHRAVHRMMCRPTGRWPDTGRIRYGWATDLPECVRQDLKQRGLMP